MQVKRHDDLQVAGNQWVRINMYLYIVTCMRLDIWAVTVHFRKSPNHLRH